MPLSGTSRFQDDQVELRETRPCLVLCSCRGCAAPSSQDDFNTIHRHGSSNKTQEGDFTNGSPSHGGLNDPNYLLNNWLDRLGSRMFSLSRSRPHRALTRMDKARLRFWLLRNESRAWLIRAILYQANPRLACTADLVSMIRGSAVNFQSLELECPPLHKLLRLPTRYRAGCKSQSGPD